MDSTNESNEMVLSGARSILSQGTGNTTFDVMSYDTLKGGMDATAAQKIFYASQSGMRLKQVRATLNNASITVEAGALHFLKGNIEVTNKMGGVGGFISKKITSKLTGEGAFNPTYSGTGEVYLEPSFGHFLLVQLNNETMICDKGMFYAADSGIEVSVAMQSNVSSALLGGEGLFQTKLSGTGTVVLASPVPDDEVVKVPLVGSETLQVDGNFALLRKGNISFTVEKSTKGLLGTLTSGEGLLQTFRGQGEVWIAPTQSIYEKMSFSGLASMTGPSAGSNTKTASGATGLFKGLLKVLD